MQTPLAMHLRAQASLSSHLILQSSQVKEGRNTVCDFSICFLYFSELSIKAIGDWHWPNICVCDSVVGFLFPHPCHGRESAKLLACTSHPPIAYKWLMHFGRRHFRSPNPGKVALFPLFFSSNGAFYPLSVFWQILNHCHSEWQRSRTSSPATTIHPAIHKWTCSNRHLPSLDPAFTWNMNVGESEIQ